MMGSFGLPMELSRTILEQTVVTVGLRQAVKLRLICKKWDHEIQMAICTTRLLENDRLPLHGMNVTSFLAVEYIFRRTICGHSSKDNMGATICDTVDCLLQEGSDLSINLRGKYIRDLCAAALHQIGLRLALYCLHPGAETALVEERWGIETLSNTLTVAAALLGDLAYFERIPKDHTFERSENLYFGNPLQCAAGRGRYDIARLLLKRGFNVKHRKFHSSALQAAAGAGEEDVVRLLLDPEYECERSGGEYEKSILCAARHGHVKILQLLIEHGDLPPTALLYNRILFAGASLGHEEIVRNALENGADPNCHEAKDNFQRPLRWATQRGHSRVVRMLLENGAVEVGKIEGLQRAASGGYKDTAKTFLDRGTDVNCNACAAIYGAASQGQAEMLLFLVKQGARPDLITDERAEQLVNIVARRGYVSVLRILAVNGINVNPAFPRLPSTPMMEAMKSGQAHIVKALIELGGTEMAPIDECILRVEECRTVFDRRWPE